MGKKKRKREKKLSAAPPKGVSGTRTLGLFLEQHIRWVFLGLVFLGALCSYMVFDPHLDTNGDNAHFIVLGMSLAQGKGLTRIATPGAPAETLVPFGFPLLLAPFLALFPGNHLLLKLFINLLFVLSLPLLLMVLRDRAGTHLLPFSVAILAAINLNLMDFSHVVMTEIPFLFFSLAGILALLRFFRFQGSRMPRGGNILFGFSILALAFSYYIRSVGVVLLLALILFLLLQKRYRLALIAGLAILCLVLPWVIRNQAVDGGGISYLDAFMLKSTYNPALGRITAGDIWARVVSNFKIYGLLTIPRVLFPSLSPAAISRGLSGILLILSLVLTGLTLTGFFLKVRQSIGFLELYTFVFLGVCVVWPQVWSGMRFLIPVVPFVIFYFLVGLWAVAQKLSSWLVPFAGKSFILIVLALMVFSSCSALVRASGRIKKYPPQWQNYFLVAEWCREHTPQESIFVARKPWLFYLKAHRLVRNYPYTADTEEMLAFLAGNRVNYVILDGFTWTGTTARYLVPAVMKHKEKFRAVYGLDNPQTWVLKTTGFSPQEEGGSGR